MKPQEISLNHLIRLLLLPFAAGYFLSYLYRTANAVIGPVLASELALPDNALGLLTSTYFLAFGAAQLPIGLLLDRFGPRRVEALLLLVAALGVGVFAAAHSLTGLAIGRGLIGLGVAACLMASMKAFSQWLPADRQAAMAAWIMASGGLGALVAAKPLEMAIGLIGWREICLILAILTLAVGALIWWVVPDKPQTQPPSSFSEQMEGVKSIFGSRHFWTYAPMAFWFTGGFMALQGLWASRWMSIAEGLDAAEVATRLSWMSLCMLGGFLFLGFLATPLIRRGLGLDRLYRYAMLAALIALVVITELPRFGSDWLWPLLAACFSLSNVSYSLVATAFPVQLSGRANTALNLLVFAGAFGLQWGFGLLTDYLRGAGGSPETAFQTAFHVILTGQFLSLTWLFVASRRR